ncbi:MAG: NAD(P)H-dependent oxidoreductase [Bacteroidota bacterium]
MKKILIISGTNRPDALSPSVARSYAALAETSGLSAEIIDLRDLPEDFTFTALYKNSGKNEQFNVFREKMKDAEKFVFIVPEYNGSFPGVLKAFIDGLEFPDTFTDKKAALIGVSAGDLGSAHAMSHLTDILNYCRAHVLARKPRFTKLYNYVKDGTMDHEPYLDQIQKQINELIVF